MLLVALLSSHYFFFVIVTVTALQIFSVTEKVIYIDTFFSTTSNEFNHITVVTFRTYVCDLLSM